MDFAYGFVFGFLLKDGINKCILDILTKSINIYHSHKKPKLNEINNICFICKITDTKLFNSLFPDGKVQPYWDYYPETGVIKIKLDQDLVNFVNKIELSDPLVISTLLSFSKYITIDYQFFQKMGDIFVYFEYHLDGKDYINVYTPCNEITNNHFTELNSRYEIPACVCFKYPDYTRYITNYYKKFINNFYPITPTHLVLFDNLLNKKDAILCIIDKKGISNILINEFI